MANNFNFAEEKILEENSPEEEMVDELLVEDLPEPEREEEETRVKRKRIGSQTAERNIGEAQIKVAQPQRSRGEETKKVSEMESSKERLCFFQMFAHCEILCDSVFQPDTSFSFSVCFCFIGSWI